MARVFIVGAGFSYHISGGAFPVMQQLGTELQGRFDWLSSYIKLSDFDVERALTLFDLEALQAKDPAQNESLQRRRDAVKSFLAERLDVRRVTPKQIERARELCGTLFRADDRVITFNYDCLLDRVLWHLKIWSPNGGYGTSPGMTDLQKFGLQVPRIPDGVVLLKLHGSLNFVQDSSGPDSYLRVAVNDEYFPGIHCHWSEPPHVPPVTLPSYVKVFGETRTMMHIWHEACHYVAEADCLTLIGYSIPRGDTMARFLISFLGSNRSGSRGHTLQVAVLSGTTEHAAHVGNQVCELGQFAREGIELRLFGAADCNAYDNLARVIQP